jgi:lysophospholipase L1-like esterase
LINAEGEIMLVDTLIPILVWSNDAATLLSAGKGGIVYNKYSKGISIVTGSQLWVVNFNPKSLFFYDGELFSWDAENSILIKIKDIDNLSKWVAEVDSKAKVGVLAQNTLDKIVMKSVGDEIVNDELFDILISATTGEETDYSGAYASGYIPIIGNEEYYISGSMAWGNAVYAWYDEDKKFISGYAAEGGSTITRIVNDLVVAPTNAAYIRVCRWTTNQEGKVNEVKLSAVTEGNSGWKGKKWVCVGDSLTEHNSRATKSYHDYVAEVTGIEVVNMGVSGTGYKRQEENGRAFYQRVENIPSDADVITIFGSGNDGAYWGSNLGTALDATTDTIGGCINITIDNILAKMPLAVVGIVSPTPWNNNKPGDDTMMKKYANLLKQICENRGIPFLDLFHNSGLRPWDESFKQLAYSRDEGNGVHPDENGHKLIAPRFKAFLETLIM